MADTGTPDTTYDLASVLYHSLQGADTYEKYVRDAEQRNDQDLAGFFRDVQKEETQRAQRAERLLADRLRQS